MGLSITRYRWSLAVAAAMLSVTTCGAQSPTGETASPTSNLKPPAATESQKSTQTPAKSRRTRPASEEPVDVEAFVKEHLPQLSTLLSNLKKRELPEYEKASRELERTVQRLQSIRRRDEELYTAELEIWKVRHQLQLLAAQSAIATDEQKTVISEKLTKYAERHAKLEVRRLRVLRKRAAEQLAQLDKQIEERKNNEAELVAKAVRQWENRIKRQQATARKAKNSSKTKSNDTSK